MSIAQRAFHIVCKKEYIIPESHDEEYFQNGFKSTTEFFVRFNQQVDFRDKKIMDVGCGYGTTCIYMAINGAQRVVGVDVQANRVNFAKSKLKSEYGHLSDSVEFRTVTGIEELGDEKFDIVISKDSFEHYSNPEKFVFEMKKLLRKGGIMVIGFSPLWKSPHGGHIGYVTNFPWAHLIFSESVIMQERKRLLPHENVNSFEEVPGGLNKMTLARFTNIMRDTGLEPIYLRTNISTWNPWLMRLSRILSHLPFCQEYFTWNVYSIWRYSD